MAMAGASHRDDEEEDDEEDEGFDDSFMKQMNALKRACQLHADRRQGGEVGLRVPAAANDFEEEEDSEDDDALLLSIERKFSSRDGLASGKTSTPVQLRFGNNQMSAGSVPADEDVDQDVDEYVNGTTLETGRSLASDKTPASALGGSNSDEDEDLLRSITQSCGALDLMNAGKHAQISPEKVEQVTPEPAEAVYEDSCHEGGKAGQGMVNTDAIAAIRSFLPAQLNEVHDFGSSTSQLALCDRAISGKDNCGEPEDLVPENVRAVAEALSKNRLCQQTLRKVLLQVELKQQENSEMQRRAHTLIEFQKFCTRKFKGFFTEEGNSSVALIASKSRQRRRAEFKVKGPPENPDVDMYRKLLNLFPLEHNVRKWSQKERENLIKGVRQQVQEIRLRAVMEDLTSDDEDENFNKQLQVIGESELTPEDLKKGLPAVDWDVVARIYVSSRTSSECKLQWDNNENPLVNFRPWTKAEDKKLLCIAQDKQMVDWAVIAEKLGTQRIPAQCFIRFQRSLNASILRGAWTPEEDEQLKAAVQKFGEKDWQAVAASLEGRANNQCMNRWSKVVHPDRHRTGRWQAEEDTRLKWAISVYGPRGWKKIATHVPGRSDMQCRERWCNVLDPSIKIDEWTPEENAKLEDLVAKYGCHHWATVAGEMGSRTDNQCFRHWKVLHPKHKMSFKKDMEIRRAVFSANFVGREKERPQLGLNDFVPPSEAGETPVVVKQLGARRSSTSCTGRVAKKACGAKGVKGVEAADVLVTSETTDISKPVPKRRKRLELPMTGNSHQGEEGNCPSVVTERNNVGKSQARRGHTRTVKKRQTAQHNQTEGGSLSNDQDKEREPLVTFETTTHVTKPVLKRRRRNLQLLITADSHQGKDDAAVNATDRCTLIPQVENELSKQQERTGKKRKASQVGRTLQEPSLNDQEEVVETVVPMEKTKQKLKLVFTRRRRNLELPVTDNGHQENCRDLAVTVADMDNVDAQGVSPPRRVSPPRKRQKRTVKRRGQAAQREFGALTEEEEGLSSHLDQNSAPLHCQTTAINAIPINMKFPKEGDDAEEEDDPLHIHHKVRKLMGPKRPSGGLQGELDSDDDTPGDLDSLAAVLLLECNKRG